MIRTTSMQQNQRLKAENTTLPPIVRANTSQAQKLHPQKFNSNTNTKLQSTKTLTSKIDVDYQQPDPKLFPIKKNVKKLEKPSARYSSIKTADPFAIGKQHKTNFAYVYSAGGIPCRIGHNYLKLSLKWDIEPALIDYDPILVVCFEGLLETEHPYNFTSRQCIRELLTAENARDKVNNLLPKVINSLRAALSSSNDEIFGDTIKILEMLSELVKDKLNSYLHFFLQNINKRTLNPKFKEIVYVCLTKLEANGGELALKEIKKKIPTYTSPI